MVFLFLFFLFFSFCFVYFFGYCVLTGSTDFELYAFGISRFLVFSRGPASVHATKDNGGRREEKTKN